MTDKYDNVKELLSTRFHTGQVIKWTASDLNTFRGAFLELIQQVEKLQARVDELELRQQKTPSPTIAADEGNV